MDSVAEASIEADTRRILWRCRRGLLELDLVLAAFVRQHYARLTPAQLQAFDALLDYPDNQLWDMVTERQHSEDAGAQAILALLRRWSDSGRPDNQSQMKDTEVELQAS